MSFASSQRHQRARGNVTASMLVWALLLAGVLFYVESALGPPTGRSVAGWLGLGVTVLFGLDLGWRRRGAAIFVAPLVSWFVAWPLLWIAAIVRNGVLRGFVHGLFLITVGWLVIGTIEFVVLGLGVWTARFVRRRFSHEPTTVIVGPDGVER